MGVIFFLLLAIVVLAVVGGAVLGILLHVLWWAIVGLVVGILARLVLPDDRRVSLLQTILFGIAGALLGGVIAGALDVGWFIEFNDEQHGDRDPYAIADATRELIEAVGRLPQERRVVVVLRLLFGYTPDEVATMLDVRVGTVHSRLSRGLHQLRDHLGVPDEA
ncbi:MAG TPA: sigma factor-like helix-turn-helix DNA-binding protein [Miltoncostaea sp.]|nr:sigma factor-like helix-turn-helix DNA-binding protein [Miltoncostaea sp.]